MRRIVPQGSRRREGLHHEARTDVGVLLLRQEPQVQDRAQEARQVSR